MNTLTSKVDIIITSWNNLSYTRKCIESIRENTLVSYHLIVVDNGSTDGTREYLQNLSDAEVIQLDSNIGYIKATNIGMKASKAPYIVLQNNDTEVPKGWLTSLLEVADLSNDIGLVGPLSSASTQYQYYANFDRQNGRYVLAPMMVAFFSTLIKREVIDKIGYLDEKKFDRIWCEDDDYCMMARKAGFLIAIDVKTVVTHKHRATINNLDEDKKAIYQKNRQAFLKKHNLLTKPKVFLVSLTPEFPSCLQCMIPDFRYQVVGKSVWNPDTSNNRNIICREFLKTEAEFLVMIDSDNIPPPHILDLVLLDKDVIGGVYPQWKEYPDGRGDIMWSVCNKVPDGYKQVPVSERGGLREADAIFSGVIIIKRKVLEAIKAPFERKWDEDGIQLLGHDFYFCEKAKAKGFKVWVHWAYMCGHRKELDLVKVAELLTREKENG